MAIRPGNLTPRQNALRKPDDNQKLNGQIVNGPQYPEFGGAEAVARRAKKAPYGVIDHVGKRGNP